MYRKVLVQINVQAIHMKAYAHKSLYIASKYVYIYHVTYVLHTTYTTHPGI
jgi:hypothetical protein